MDLWNKYYKTTNPLPLYIQFQFIMHSTPFSFLSTRILMLLIVLFGLFYTTSCKKTSPDAPRATYAIHFDNAFNLLQARYAAYLTDEEGKVVLFKWLSSSDTSSLTVPFSDFDKYDCTIFKMVITPTATRMDTAVEMISYPQVPNKTTIFLRDNDPVIITDLKVQFTGLSTLDSIIVPNGLTFVKPQENTSFFGHYNVRHHGDFWLRARFDGDQHWKYMVFNNYQDANLTVSLDKNILPGFVNPNATIQLPFLAQWQYQIQGEVGGNENRLMPIGDLRRAPGGAVPLLDQLEVFRPESVSFSRYRVQMQGSTTNTDAYTYYCDQYFTNLPATLPIPAFNIGSTTLGDSRLVGVQCIGEFNNLVIRRANSTIPSITWTAYTAPINGGITTHRLPDVPTELSTLFSGLKNYNFGSQVLVRAEKYQTLTGFEAVQSMLFLNENPNWRANAGMVGIERSF